MKLCIVMWYDQEIAWYGDSNYKINKAYCDKHGIDLFLSNERRHNRHLVWEKVPMILKYINDYDYVMWIDSDAHFYLDSKNIIELINEHIQYNIIFSKDYSDSLITGTGINAGVFIVKNTKYTIDFLKKWVYDENLFEKNTYPFWHDQGVLLDMYANNVLDIQQNSIILDYGVIQHFHKAELVRFEQKPYILHLAGQGAEIRFNHPLNYIEENGLN